MSKIIWTDGYNIGVEEIDRQHRRIVDYINQLKELQDSDDSMDKIAALMHQLMEYTNSHFAFEESMMEEAKYPNLLAHKEIHAEFVKRVNNYQSRFDQGEDVAIALNSMLVIWLFNHIKKEDAAYVKSVKAYQQNQSGSLEKKKGILSWLFR